ncbi:hypothetical protein N7533_010863 [Penicillium manginii]|uniref:uncharacterized protein n=1 Tax=Penicillium manginii TaxID=203109 RepID=UPI002546AFFB|nr:uncharacterized protein N7533_010863 [Penicillium manginii]KAJ5741454.1 hypothetical protein N7533_010863 [Penicillium manginii]
MNNRLPGRFNTNTQDLAARARSPSRPTRHGLANPNGDGNASARAQLQQSLDQCIAEERAHQARMRRYDEAIQRFRREEGRLIEQKDRHERRLQELQDQTRQMTINRLRETFRYL